MSVLRADGRSVAIPLHNAVPLVDLSRAGEELFRAADEVFARLARAGAFTLGEELQAFEAEFAAYCGTSECVGISDGTNALRIALEALGVGPGDEVITVANTFVATVEAVAATGASPVLVDVDPGTRCMDVRRLTDALGPRTAAVVPVHLYGVPAATDEILDACGDIPVVEDAAQAHGAKVGERRVGALAAAGCFSFYPTKNLGAMGDGGAVTCDDPALAAAMRSLRHHGCDHGDPNRHLRRGATARLDNLQAAILRLKLRRLDGWNDERRLLAERYRTVLEDLPLTLPPADQPGCSQVYHLFVIEVDDRDSVLARLRADGVRAGVHYPTPVHLQPAWRRLGYREGDLPCAERLARRVLSLPMFPGMTDDEVAHVAGAVRRALA